MPLQKLLNAWVGVNNKHVVFPNADRRSGHAERRSNHAERRSNNAERRSSREDRRSHQSDGSSDGGSDTVKDKNLTKEDQELQAIRRFSSRRHRRRLLRTNSATDLIREQANQRVGDYNDTSSQTSDKITISSAQTSGAVTRTTASGSIRTIPTPIPTPEPTPEPPPEPLPSTRPSLHAPYKQKQSLSSTPASSQGSHMTVPHSNLQKISNDGGDSQTIASNNSENSIKWVAGFFGADVATESSSLSNSYYPSAHHDSTQHSQSSAVTPTTLAATSSSGGIRFFPKSFVKPNCPSCKALEVQMGKAHEDIEYLRGVAIRNEYVCKCCQNSNTAMEKADHSSTLRRMSQRLEDASYTHKMQVERLTKEHSESQRDMNLKLSDLSNLCERLDKKSIEREKTCISLQNEVHETRTQRDELAGEIEKLRAEVRSYEKMEEEYKKLKAIMQNYERKGIVRASQAIETRDKLIADLSLRLEVALDTLEIERQQQKQRRQIMFPSRQGEDVAEKTSAQVFEELRKTKEELRISQSSLEKSKADARRREIALNTRCENLEKQLDKLR